MATALATRYARALVDLATRPGVPITPHRILDELELFERALADSPALKNVLLSPAVPAPQKRKLVARVAAGLGLSDLTRRFLLVVTDRRRMGLLAEMRQAAETLLDARLGVVRVDVTSARVLSEAQREALAAGFQRLTGLRPRPRFALDPELIGGVVARVGSTIYDGSVRGRLEALKRRLAGAEG
jgi:F-type H+-transporting ATPase subunit delta